MPLRPTDISEPPGRPLSCPRPLTWARLCLSATDVAVIGGGLAGCAIAYYLARSGVDVVVLERGELNREASGSNSGSFHFQIAIHQLTGSDLGPDRERLLADVRLHAAAACRLVRAGGRARRRPRRARHGWADGGRDSRRAGDPGGQTAHREGRGAGDRGPDGHGVDEILPLTWPKI